MFHVKHRVLGSGNAILQNNPMHQKFLLFYNALALRRFDPSETLQRTAAVWRGPIRRRERSRRQRGRRRFMTGGVAGRRWRNAQAISTSTYSATNGALASRSYPAPLANLEWVAKALEWPH
jgi:hypothetical protein